MNKQLSERDNTNNELKLEIQRLEKVKEQLSSELNEVTFKLEELQRIHQTSASKIKDLETKMKTNITDYERFETERRAWKDTEREAETAKILLQQKVLQLENKFKAVDAERKELKGKVFASQDEISDLEFKLESKTSEATSLEAQVKILSEKYEKNLAENSRMNSELGNLKLTFESTLRDLSDKDDDIKQLHDRNTRVESEMASLKETMFSNKDSGQKEPQLQEKLQRELLDAHKMVSELDVRVKKAEMVENRIRDELKRKNDKITNLEIELDEVSMNDDDVMMMMMS